MNLLDNKPLSTNRKWWQHDFKVKILRYIYVCSTFIDRQLSSRNVLCRFFSDGFWDYFVRFLEVGGWLLSLFDWSTFPFIEKNREKSSPMQWTEGCEWANGPSVTLRLSIFTHRSTMDSPFFPFLFGLLLALSALLITALVDWQTNADSGSALGSDKGLALAQNR